ncbi:hypothetical protein ACFLZY_01770 [Patescibacteria group bacterium]
MSRRSKLVTIFILILIAVVLIVVWLLWRRQPVISPSTIIPVEQTQTPPVEITEQTTQPTAGQIEQEARIQSSSIQTLAKVFVERYGSFSSEAHFANLNDVMSLITDSLAAEFKRIPETTLPSPEYYGVTTRLVSVDVDFLDEQNGQASLTVNTQREEAKGSPQNLSVRYQGIKLEMEKVTGIWKVSSAVWQ